MNTVIGLEDLNALGALKAAYAFDDGAALWHNADNGGIGFGLLHYAFVRNLQPDYGLVIGSRYGFIPACIALALKANGKGRLHFVDANYNDQTDHYAKAYGGSGHWSRPIQELFGTLELHKWIEMFIERTDSFFPRTATQYGYIYIDGNHSYEGVAYDFGQALERLLPGGIVAIHDALVDESYGATLTDPGGFGIKDYLRKHFPHAIVLGRWPGLALVQPRWPEPAPGAPTQATDAQQRPVVESLEKEQSRRGDEPTETSGLAERHAALELRVQQLESMISATSKAAVLETREQLQRQDAYYELIARVRNIVREMLPPNATVLVASKGDDQFVSFGTQRGWHFPRNDAGLYSGEHPGDSAEAIAALEQMRLKGAQYLLFPQTSFWWLDSYPEFRTYLETHYRMFVRREDICVIFSLSEAC